MTLAGGATGECIPSSFPARETPVPLPSLRTPQAVASCATHLRFTRRFLAVHTAELPAGHIEHLAVDIV